MLCTVFYSSSSNIDEVPSINASANVFVFGDFNVHHKVWLTYSDRTGLCYNFSISNNLTCNHLRDVPWEDIFKLSVTAPASDFCEVGIDVYIPHRNYQVKPHSSPWFSAACAAAIVHRNNLFCLYQQSKSSESKVKLRQTSNRCEGVLEAAKLACATKIKSESTSQKLGSWDFWRIANSVLLYSMHHIPPLFNAPEVLYSASNETKLFAKNVFKNFNLDDPGCISLSIFHSRNNVNCIIFP